MPGFQRSALQIGLAIFLAAFFVAILGAFLAALPASAANAPETKHRATKPPAKSHSVATNPCAKYGPGFVKLAGSDTLRKDRRRH